ncbi:MAG TPA: enolase C-terminal domain-like protein [Burkholderiales bacterium]
MATPAPLRLEGWTLDFYRLPYAHEVKWANALEREGTFALLTLRAGGCEGVAEGTLKHTWSGVSPRVLAAALEDVILPRLAGIDLGDAAAVSAAWRGVPENTLAKTLADNACWTLRAAVAGTPLWALWGGRRQVEIAWTVTRQPPSAMAAECAQACARHGFRTLKVKGGQGLDTDLRALREIRAAVGPSVELYVDANSEYPAAEGADYVRALAAEGVTLAEDPCPLEPGAAFEALQREVPLPILVDRSCASSRDARLFLERGVRALSAKPGRVGLSETRAIAALAAAASARVAVGLYAESLLGTLISLQQAAALAPALTIAAEQTFFMTMTGQVTATELPIRNGCVLLPDSAALAACVDRAAVRRYAL